MKTIHIPRRFVREHWGGTETVILETVRRLTKLGHETEVFTSEALSTPALTGYTTLRFVAFAGSIPSWGFRARTSNSSTVREATSSRPASCFGYSSIGDPI